jgi:dATP pyrophosphohydrolase
MSVKTAGVIIFVLRRLASGCEVLFLRRSGGAFKSQWWPVGGTCKPGEAAIATAVRELREETGLFPRELYHFGENIAHMDGRSKIEAFVAFVAEQDPVVLNCEHSAYRWLSSDEALEIVADPRHILRLRDHFMNAAPATPRLRPDE